MTIFKECYPFIPDRRVNFFGNAGLNLELPQSSFMCMLLLRMSRLLVYPVISALSILSAASQPLLAEEQINGICGLEGSENMI